MTAIVAVASLLLFAGTTPAADPASRAELRVELAGLRNGNGVVLVCLSANPKHFPDCGSDPAARRLKARADRTSALLFRQIPAGAYALSVMHDENGNARLDTLLGIPREGFGFSRNPVVRFGAPKFREVMFAMPSHAITVPIRMKYFL